MDLWKVLQLYLFLKVNVHLVFGVTHSLQYFYTGVTPERAFPEFTAAGFVDGQQIVYYDSNIRKMIPKTDWMKNITDKDPSDWRRQTQKQQGDHEIFKINRADLLQRFRQTEGVHTLQNIYGCELDADGTIRHTYSQFGYDGEDFISLDIKTETWTADHPKAQNIKQTWEEINDPRFIKDFLQTECIDWLQKYVKYGRSALERKVRPKTDLFQKDSSSPVVCHATGFFPKAVMMSWQKNGEDVHEDVELRETVPNEDGSFQKRSVLTVSPEELKKNKYTCVIQHSSLEEKEIHLSDIRVLTDGGSVGIIIGAVVVVLLLVLVGCVGFFIWKKKSESTEDSTSSSALDQDGGGSETQGLVPPTTTPAEQEDSTSSSALDQDGGGNKTQDLVPLTTTPAEHGVGMSHYSQIKTQNYLSVDCGHTRKALEQHL